MFRIFSDEASRMLENKETRKKDPTTLLKSRLKSRRIFPGVHQKVVVFFLSMFQKSFFMMYRMNCQAIVFILILSLSSAWGGEDTSMERLDNGLTLLSRRTKANSILGVICLIRTGSFYELSEQNGITNLVQSLLMKGTERFTSAELALALESEGISMNVDASEDYASVSAEATVDQLDKVLDLMSEVLLHPTFPPEEVEKERRNAIAYIHLQEDDKFSLAFKNLREILFEGHPYSQNPEGRPETLEQISRSQILKFHNRFYKPPNMILAIVGDVPHAPLKKSVERFFGSGVLEPFEIVSLDKKIDPTPKSRELKKSLEQGFITMGYIGVPMNHKDYPALRVASALLGEGMASRFFSDLRDKQGLAYAVGSFYMNLKYQGSVIGYIGTRPESISQARSGMQEMFTKLSEKPIPEEEMERARNFIIGKFLINHQTNLKKAFYLAWFEMYGLGWAFDDQYPDMIRSVLANDVRRVARKYFRSPSIVNLVPEKSPDNKE